MNELQKEVRAVLVSTDSALVESIACEVLDSGDELSSRIFIEYSSKPKIIGKLSNYEVVAYDLDIVDGDLQRAALHLLEYKNRNRSIRIILISSQKSIAAAMESERIASLVERTLTKPIVSGQLFIAIAAASPQLSQGLVANYVPLAKKLVLPSAILGLSIVAMISFFLSNSDKQKTTMSAINQVQTSPHIDKVIAGSSVIEASASPVDTLYGLALAALAENNIVLPNGSNALFYLNNVLDIDPYHHDAYTTKLSLLKQLRASFPEALSLRNFEQADKIIEALTEGEPYNKKNADLRSEFNRAIDSGAVSEHRLVGR
jgi:hypothetical protein